MTFQKGEASRKYKREAPVRGGEKDDSRASSVESIIGICEFEVSIPVLAPSGASQE